MNFAGPTTDTIRKKKKLMLRVARIRGQVEALARALDGEAGCGEDASGGRARLASGGDGEDRPSY